LNEKGYQKLQLGPIIGSSSQPQQLVLAGMIFGSTVNEKNSYALVSCVVAPGFDFADFELFTEDQLVKLYPNSLEIIKKLT
jgi:predicted cupin superfamily sugar epimerase